MAGVIRLHCDCWTFIKLVFHWHDSATYCHKPVTGYRHLFNQSLLLAGRVKFGLASRIRVSPIVVRALSIEVGILSIIVVITISSIELWALHYEIMIKTIEK